MKKLLLIIALVVPITSFAQTKKKATFNRKPTTQKATVLPGLKVFGIGFETTRKRYEQELAKKGYIKSSKFSNYDEYTVEFAGHKDCKFRIYYNVTTDSITIIRIKFPYDTYDKCSNPHYELVKQLDAKYGESKRNTLGVDLHQGLVMNTWNSNGIKIEADCLWNSRSNKDGENSLSLSYYTNASTSSEIKPNEDL